MKRWDWTWEEPRSSARVRRNPDAEVSPGPVAGPAEALARFRRRRAGGGLVLLALLALLIAAIGSHGGSSRRAPRPASRQAASARLTPAQENALTSKAEDRAVDSVLAYAPVVVQGGGKGNEVALTFDDGPGPYTQRLVDVLNGLHVQATFFAIGKEEQYFSAGTLQELRSGDVVGDHTETHPMMATLSAHDQREQLLEQTYRIELLNAPAPRLFRPPYGSFDATTLKELHAQHMLMILWSTDTADFARPGAQVIAQRVLEGAHPGAIILMHDGGGDRSQTIAALPTIVRGLRARGLRPVTIPRLLLDDPPLPGQRIPTSLSGG